ncbi:MAG TPA: VOC family protein [Solirubrobacteraceae bacterium]|jgi:uncharacterized glyoxalase superfamily protein PhnB|nr:VOC family protein [Solirubrobacteraceae bacterium]
MTAYVIPTIRVSSRAVLEHWVEAFGIELQVVHGEGDVVEHAQLRLGDGRLMSGTSREEDVGKPPGSAAMYWVLDRDPDVDTVYERAVAAGATSVRAPEDQGYGGRGCTLADRDGNLWSFGSYKPAG